MRAALELRRSGAKTAILVVSQYVEHSYAAELLAEAGGGGVGYLLKDRVLDVADFVDAIRRVASGGAALDPEVVAQLLAARKRPLEQLTPREQEVLELMAEGRSNSAIAETLVLTLGAVEKHVASIFQKLRLPRHRATTAASSPSSNTFAVEPTNPIQNKRRLRARRGELRKDGAAEFGLLTWMRAWHALSGSPQVSATGLR